MEASRRVEWLGIIVKAHHTVPYFKSHGQRKSVGLGFIIQEVMRRWMVTGGG
jgi:hypothetical protein